MAVMLEDWSEVFKEAEDKGTPMRWATVAYMNEDGSVQVKMNGSSVTTRCATWCKCEPGDRVVVSSMSSGSRCVIANYSTGTLPDGSVTLDKLEGGAKDKVEQAITATEKAVQAVYEEFTATGGRDVPPAADAVWTEDVPDGVSLSKIWKRRVTVWLSGRKEYGEPEPMQKLVRVATEYYLSTSRDGPEGGQWAESAQGFVSGMWLWTRQRSDYICPASSAYSAPALDSAWAAAADAVEAAGNATTKAEEAKAAADKAAADIAPVAQGVTEAKAAADAAKAEAKANTEQITGIKADYATKNEVTEIQGNLSASIEANATAIASKVSAEEFQKNTEEANAAIAAAKEAAAAAQASADGANADLATAKSNLEKLQADQSATEAELAAAKAAVEAAQASADGAQAAADALASDLEGLSGRVASAESAIEQTAETVETTVARVESAHADADAVADALQALKDGELADMADELFGMQGSMTSILQDFRQIQMEFTEVAGAVGEGVDAAAAVTIINRYIRFKEGNIELGQTTSPYRVVIKSDRISFMNGDTEMAYMSGDKLSIKNAEVVQQLVVGDHSLESSSPGHLTFKYVGE